MTDQRYTKSNLPEKICAACGRPFAWRKKWARDWDNVKTYSERCTGDLRRKNAAGSSLSLEIVMQMQYSRLEKEARMTANALVQTRIDAEVKTRAAAVLETMGLTVSDVVRIVLTRTAREGALPFELVADQQAYDAWFRAKVHDALNDPRPDIAHEDVEAEFAARRAAILK